MSQWLSIIELAARVQSGELKARDLVEKSLKTIADKKEYDAVIVTLDERALERADEIDARVANGETVGALAGVPFIAKDNFLVFGADTTAASNILKGFEAPYQATAINRLEAAGAICVGKANLDEFAHGGSTENSAFFTTKNPHDKTRVPGGSSGGSAASVVLDMVPFAIGTDTGGSIRQPAALCGVTGLKPTYGRVSRYGMIAFASSLDQGGTLTATAEDAALVLRAMAGFDARDSTSVERPVPDYVAALEQPLAGLKIGLLKEFFEKGLDPEHRGLGEQIAPRGSR